MQQPKRIILRAPNWLGDHVMALSFYQGVRSLFPTSRITLLVPKALTGLFPRSLFDEEWAFSVSDMKNAKVRDTWIRKIREHGFDLSICLPASWSSALLFFQARVPYRVGFSESGSGILLNRAFRWEGVKAHRHKSILYLDLLKAFGESPEKCNQKVVETQEKKTTSPSYWVLAPGASLPLREWPYFPELLFELKKKYPDTLIKVVGTEAESVWKTRLNRWALPGVQDLVGKTTISQLREICAQSQLVIANDSGVAHLSASIGNTPTVVLFGPGDPQYIAPQGPGVIGVRAEQVACSPCEKPYCRAPFGYQKCLKEISVDAVLNQIGSALSL